jgi:hypothetical protein
MEPNSQTAAPGAARAESWIRIQKRGKMLSKNPQKRYLYLYIEPFEDELESGITKALNILNSLLAVWRPPVRRSFFRPDMWWEHVPCQHCIKRIEFEMKKWQANERAWYRNMCLRHWFVHHLSMTLPGEPKELISNRPIGMLADASKIHINIETVNYKYNIVLNKEIAKMAVVYKDRTYKFTFNNHLKSYPYISSFMNIMLDAYNVLEIFRDFLSEYVLKRRLSCNLVINDFIILPPAAAGECNACKL